MTTALTPAETLDAIATYRAGAEVRRTELLTERRSLAPRVLIGDPAALAKVTQVSNDLRDIDGTLEDFEETESQALAAIAAVEDIEREGWKVATINAIGKGLRMRDTLAEGIDAKLADLLGDLRTFDDLSADIQGHACLYGRPETIGFLSPKPSDELLFERLVSMSALPAVAMNGRIVFHATIANISRSCGEQLWGHLVELLPPEARPSAVVPKDTPKKDKRKAKAAPVQEQDEDFTDDLPLENV